MDRSSINKAKDVIVLGTETEYIVHEESEIPSTHRKLLGKPATNETLEELVRCIPSKYLLVDDPLNPAYNGFILKNGGRLYIDGPFIEYATPECFSAKGISIYEEVGNRILMETAEIYSSKTGRALNIYKMIPDVEGKIEEEVPGYHENYGLRQDCYFNLFLPNFWPKEPVFKVLIPFLVTRQLYAGAGGLVSDSAGVHYEISQRAKWIEKELNYTSSRNRPILHLKRPNLNETHLRIHITCGDPNRISYATFLKIGTTAVVLACLGQEALQGLDFELADSVKAFRAISTHGSISVHLKRGAHLSAIRIQESLLDEIQKEQNNIMRPECLEWDEIINEWKDTLQLLSKI